MRKLRIAFGASVLFLGLLAAPATAQEETPPDAKQVEDGKKIFTGKGLCMACHGADAKGTPLAPDLTDEEWLNVDGTLQSIVALVRTGVQTPKEHPAPMPPMGGASLKPEEIEAVAAYVWSLSHPSQ